MRMPAVNEKQADFIVGARVLENPRGTAPGFWAAGRGVEIVVLPGVPSEMKEIMDGQRPARARARARPAKRPRRRVLRIGGTGESAVEELVAPVYAKWKEHPGHDPRRRRARCSSTSPSAAAPERAGRILAAMEARLSGGARASRVFGRDDEDLAAAVGSLLRREEQDAGRWPSRARAG